MSWQSDADKYVIEARRVNALSPEAAESLARQGVATYRVISETRTGGERPKEARAQARARTRLRSAKVIDANNAFLCEAMVHDRSPNGMRLLLTRNVGLPKRFGVYEDENGELLTTTLVWRRGQTVGLRIARSGPPAPMTTPDRRALAGRYYGVRD